MHTVWKGSISFGLVNIPVKLHAATESKDVKFRQLHRGCSGPISYRKVCSVCGEEVSADDIAKGVELSPGQFTILTDEELASHQKSRSNTIDIVNFVHLSEIDPVYFDRTYYVASESHGLRAYKLLSSALEETGKIAIGKVVMRNNETLVCIRSHDGVLVMETLFWPDEVRDTDALPFSNAETAPITKELDMAKMIVEQLTTPFSPAAYTDDARESLLELLRQKTKQLPDRPAAQGDGVVDLMKALEASLKANEPKKERKRKLS